MDSVFMMYAAESEGDMLTRRGKIQKVIKLMVAAGASCNDDEVQDKIFQEVGLDSDSLTGTEIHYIEKEVEKQL